jgi:hypothetical protein
MSPRCEKQYNWGLNLGCPCRGWDNTENKLSDSFVRDAPNDIPISVIKVSFFVVCIGFFLFDLILVFYLIFLVFLIIFVVLIILIRVTIRVLLLRLVPMIDYVFFGASLNPFWL